MRSLPSLGEVAAGGSNKDVKVHGQEPSTEPHAPLCGKSTEARPINRQAGSQRRILAADQSICAGFLRRAKRSIAPLFQLAHPIEHRDIWTKQLVAAVGFTGDKLAPTTSPRAGSDPLDNAGKYGKTACADSNPWDRLVNKRQCWQGV